MHSFELGRIAEAEIVAYFVRQGYEVFFPMHGNTTCDLVVIKDGQTKRVEVKYCDNLMISGNYQVALRQIRGTKGTPQVRHFNASNSDLLAVYLETGAIAVMDSAPLHGRATLNLTPDGGPSRLATAPLSKSDEADEALGSSTLPSSA